MEVCFLMVEKALFGVNKHILETHEQTHPSVFNRNLNEKLKSLWT